MIINKINEHNIQMNILKLLNPSDQTPASTRRAVRRPAIGLIHFLRGKLLEEELSPKELPHHHHHHHPAPPNSSTTLPSPCGGVMHASGCTDNHPSPPQLMKFCDSFLLHPLPRF